MIGMLLPCVPQCNSPKLVAVKCSLFLADLQQGIPPICDRTWPLCRIPRAALPDVQAESLVEWLRSRSAPPFQPMCRPLLVRRSRACCLPWRRAGCTLMPRLQPGQAQTAEGSLHA